MLKVDVIENGTVIDHIKAGKGAKVLKIMGIGEDYPYKVALLMHVPSKKKGSKDILKIAEKAVSQNTANLIALVSPKATINIIKDGKVEKKFEVELPEKLEGAGTCPNPNCITKTEETKQIFRKEGAKYRCHYCERLFAPEELV